MLISELEERLKELKEEHGDIPVWVPNREWPEGGLWADITDIVFVEDAAYQNTDTGKMAPCSAITLDNYIES